MKISATGSRGFAGALGLAGFGRTAGGRRNAVTLSAMGSPFFARALFNQSDLTVQGSTARYASSEALDRVFCKNCGTRLFGWRRDGTVAGVALAAFDDSNAFAPTEHIWVAEKMHWVRLNDGLPQHPGAAPA